MDVVTFRLPQPLLSLPTGTFSFLLSAPGVSFPGCSHAGSEPYLLATFCVFMEICSVWEHRGGDMGRCCDKRLGSRAVALPTLRTHCGISVGY